MEEELVFPLLSCPYSYVWLLSRPRSGLEGTLEVLANHFFPPPLNWNVCLPCHTCFISLWWKYELVQSTYHIDKQVIYIKIKTASGGVCREPFAGGDLISGWAFVCGNDFESWSTTLSELVGFCCLFLDWLVGFFVVYVHFSLTGSWTIQDLGLFSVTGPAFC